MSRDVGYWLQQALNFIQIASFYAPLAVAFALLQGITRRIFLSFGDVAMFASFAAIYASFAAQLRGDSDLMVALSALLLALACNAALGFVIARAIMGRSLLSHAQSFMIASIGLSIMLREIMRLQSGSQSVWVPPLFQSLNLFEIDGAFSVRLPMMSALAIFVSIAGLIATGFVMKWTRFGRAWRACAQSLRLAQLCGVNTPATMALTFAVASGLSGIAGWTSAISYGGTNFSIGLLMGFKAMFASVVGGFGSVRGALAGAALVASIEVLWSALVSTTYRDVAVFGIIIAVLLVRPEGLLGLADKRESEVV